MRRSANAVTMSIVNRRSAGPAAERLLHRLHFGDGDVRIERGHRRPNRREPPRSALRRCESSGTGCWWPSRSRPGTARAAGTSPAADRRSGPDGARRPRCRRPCGRWNRCSPPPSRSRRPTASPLGHTCRASVWLMTMTPGAPRRSPASMPLPCSTGMPIVRKYPGVTTCQSAAVHSLGSGGFEC